MFQHTVCEELGGGCLTRTNLKSLEMYKKNNKLQK